MPEEGLVFDYKLDDGGISKRPSRDDDEEEEEGANKQVRKKSLPYHPNEFFHLKVRINY